MQKLIITIEVLKEIPHGSLVSFEGDFDGYATDDLADIQKVIDGVKEGANIIFDFAKLNYLNSYAIGHLANWYNHVSDLKGRIVIVGANKNVSDIFDILGIKTLFKIFPDKEAALEALNSEA